MTPFPPFDYPIRPQAALLVIDMQVCSLRGDVGLIRAIEATLPGYTRYFVDRVERTVIPNIRQFRRLFHASGLPVYFTAFASTVGDGSDVTTSTIRYRDQQRRARTGRSVILPRADPAADIIPELEPSPQDRVLTKTSMDAFSSTLLAAELRARGTRSLVLTGVLTDACIESSARHAAELGFEVVVAEDACAAWEEAFHASSLGAVARYFARVMPTSAICEELSTALKSRARTEISAGPTA